MDASNYFLVRKEIQIRDPQAGALISRVAEAQGLTPAHGVSLSFTQREKDRALLKRDRALALACWLLATLEPTAEELENCNFAVQLQIDVEENAP